MSDADTTTTDREAVTRLFDLAHSGEVDNCEYTQLDSLIYDRLVRNYAEWDDVRVLAASA